MAKIDDKFDYLHKLYYDPKSGAAYARLNLLYNFVKKEGKHYFTRLELKKWLETQNVYSEHKPVAKERVYGRLYSGKAGHLYDLDIGYMNNTHDVKTNKFLMAIDTFSRKINVEAVRSLKWVDIKKALDKTFAKLGKPAQVRTDQGGEFSSSGIKEYMKKHNVHMYTAFPPNKAFFSERAIKSFKQLIQKLQESSSKHTSWLSLIPKAVSIYQSRHHTSINMSPTSAALPQNRSKVMQYLNQKALERYGEPITEYEYPIKARVRVSLAKGNFSKAHTKTFSEQIYTIKERKRRDNVNYYTLADELGNVIRGSFRAYELTPTEALKPFVIEKVLPVKKTIGGILHYLVQWKHYNEKTFIPEDKLKEYTQ